MMTINMSDSERFTKRAEESVIQWAINIAYFQGLESQYKYAKKLLENPAAVMPISLYRSSVSFRYIYSYSALRLRADIQNGELLYSYYNDPFQVVLVGKADNDEVLPSYIYKTATKIRSMLLGSFANSIFENDIQICEGCWARGKRANKIGRPQVEDFGPLTICTKHFKKWMCESCIAGYSPVRRQYNKAKWPAFDHSRNLRPSRRFAILQRDSFSCKACGRSPRTDPNVKLHIDHIHPVSRGGETSDDNLQVLCLECNLGKGTKLLAGSSDAS